MGKESFHTKDIGFAGFCVVQKMPLLKKIRRSKEELYFFEGSIGDMEQLKVSYVNSGFHTFNSSLVLLLHMGSTPE